ncbi:phosphodiester glycosidase family protein [Candidatus Riflebacteria bacterium]
MSKNPGKQITTSFWKNSLLILSFLICLLQPKLCKGAEGEISLSSSFLFLKQPLKYFQSYNPIIPTYLEKKGLLLQAEKDFALVRIHLKSFSIKILLPPSPRRPLPLSELLKQEPDYIAAINGSFFHPSGLLSPVVVRGRAQGRKYGEILNKDPRTYFCLQKLKNGQERLFLSQTRKSSAVIFRYLRKRGIKAVELLGGGGWLLKKGRAVVRENYKKQGFSLYFCKVRKAPRSLFGVDKKGETIFLISIKNGKSLFEIADYLQENKVFTGLYDCMFLDGGASTIFVYKNIYLQRPIYLFDRPIYNSIVVIKK